MLFYRVEFIMTRIPVVASQLPHHRWLVPALALALALVDASLTAVLLREGASELNPLTNWMLERAGVAGLMGWRLGTALFAIGICIVVAGRHPTLGNWGYQICLAVITAPVVFAIVQVVASWVR